MMMMTRMMCKVLSSSWPSALIPLIQLHPSNGDDHDDNHDDFHDDHDHDDEEDDVLSSSWPSALIPPIQLHVFPQQRRC